MKYMRCTLYMMIGAGMALTYKAYERKIMMMCNKMKQKMEENGLDSE